MSAMGPDERRFRHEALFYDDVDEFLAGTSRFAREALDAGESVLVAVPDERARPLRERLGADASRVEFLPMAAIGRNPARIIPAWQEFVEHNARRATAFRGIGEPVWPGRSALELRECRLHEHLINTAFENGPAWSLLCAYDATRLPQRTLEEAGGSHSTLHGLGPTDVDGFDPRAGLDAFAAPLPELGPPLFEVRFGARDLAGLREAVRALADRLGLHGRGVADFVLVVDELAGNSIRHGGGRGRLALWSGDESAPGYAICEVRDAGLITDPLAGRRRPRLGPEGGGAGLWSLNRLCDLLLIHSVPAAGTTVRAYLPTS
jgi:anti-sigma regulatory factor (Ser/Thr protein kinase)